MTPPRSGAGVARASINKPRLVGDAEWCICWRSGSSPRRSSGWLRSQSDELRQRALKVADHGHAPDRYAFDLIQSLQAAGGPVGAHQGPERAPDQIVDGVYEAHPVSTLRIQLAELGRVRA